jgi:ABC-2 type transport system permease protein
MNTQKWLLKREYWEHKGGFFWAPMVISGIITLFTIGSLIIASVIGKNSGMYFGGNSDMSIQVALTKVTEPDKIEFAQGLANGYPLIGMPIIIAMVFVVFFYCLSALFDDRKDRSILFWKSLPISDKDTVISKVITATLVAPIIASIAVLTLSLFNLFVFMIIVAFHGLNLFGYVLGDADFYLTAVKFLSMIPIYALWALPTIAYLLFVSSWAKTKPFLWAVGVPVLGGVIISWMNAMMGFGLDMSSFWKFISLRWFGSIVPGTWFASSNGAHLSDNGRGFSELLMQSYQQLGHINIWIGLVIGVALIYAAIQMRRYRDEG